jgi:sulfoxide reductase catalytic subunit YedY
MLIRTPRPGDPRSSEITPRELYLRRREFLRSGAVGAVGALGGGAMLLAPGRLFGAQEARSLRALDAKRNTSYSTTEELTDYDDATSYNNFYEFGTDKEDPSENASTLVPHPWSVVIDGEVGRPGRVAFEDLVKPHTLEERVYRLRCVEAWSMVIPWVGVPLGELLKRFEPTSKAKYVAFETLVDPSQMPGQRRAVLDWPYREGLRMDEAMNPLAILATGMYGRELPNQNGAPIRLVVPWKYGFKSIKSIVRIRFSETQPRTTWNDSAPNEYGFYANVNPEVHHPRWRQSRERRIGEFGRRKTLPFNGYAEEVAALYSGMDLSRQY